MKSRILFFAVLALCLFAAQPLLASEIRMLGLGDPWLTVPDADTNWQYNPAYLMDVSQQVYENYIFGYSDDKKLRYGDEDYSFDVEGVARNHTGELGSIFNLGKGKFGIRTGYSYERYNLNGNYYSSGGNDTVARWPTVFDRDFSFNAAYALPLNSSLTLGASVSYNRVDAREKLYGGPIIVWVDEMEQSKYNRWDATLGLAWQPSDSKIKGGISVGGGGYPGDYSYDDVWTGYASGDYKGSHAQLLANLEYQANDRLAIPVVLRARWDYRKYNLTFSDTSTWLTKEPVWDVLLKAGARYRLDEESNTFAFGELFYSHEDLRSKFSGVYPAGLEQINDSEYNNTVGLKLGLERKICDKLTGRGGLYYSYGFRDVNENIYTDPTSAYNHYVSGNGAAQILGAGLGLTYAPKDNFRMDLGFDIPIINKSDYDMLGFEEGGTPISRFDRQEELRYRVGINATYLF